MISNRLVKAHAALGRGDTVAARELIDDYLASCSRRARDHRMSAQENLAERTARSLLTGDIADARDKLAALITPPKWPNPAECQAAYDAAMAETRAARISHAEPEAA